MKKLIFLLILTVMFSFASIVHAQDCNLTGQNTNAAALSISDCPYKSNHGNHSASTMNYYYSCYPDYTVGQMHLIKYYYCVGCSYVCCVIDNYFGYVVQDSETEEPGC